MYIKVAIGQDSHRFVEHIDYVSCGANIDSLTNAGLVAAGAGTGAGAGFVCRPLLLGGVEFPGGPPLAGNSDADVVLHALCNAISGVTGVNILGAEADRMCFEEGITNSAVYVKEAMKYLAGGAIAHASFSIECARPVISPRIMDMRKSIADIIGIGIGAGGVCITATSGEGLTDFGRGLGIQVLCILTVAYT